MDRLPRSSNSWYQDTSARKRKAESEESKSGPSGAQDKKAKKVDPPANPDEDFARLLQDEAHVQALARATLDAADGHMPGTDAEPITELLNQACAATATMTAAQVTALGTALANGLGASAIRVDVARAALQGLMLGLQSMEPERAGNLVAAFVRGMGGATMRHALLAQIDEALRDAREEEELQRGILEAAAKAVCRVLGREQAAGVEVGAFEIDAFLHTVGTLPTLPLPRPALPDIAPEDLEVARLARRLHAGWSKLKAETPATEFRSLDLRLQLANLALIPSLVILETDEVREPEELETALDAFVERESQAPAGDREAEKQRAFIFTRRLEPSYDEGRSLLSALVTRARAQPQLLGTLAGVLEALIMPLWLRLFDPAQLPIAFAPYFRLAFMDAAPAAPDSPLARSIEQSVTAIVDCIGRIAQQPVQLVAQTLRILVEPGLPSNDARTWIPLRQLAAAVARALPATSEVCDEFLRFALREPAHAVTPHRRAALVETVSELIGTPTHERSERLAHALATLAAEEHAPTSAIRSFAIALCPGTHAEQKADALLKSIRGLPLARQMSLLREEPHITGFRRHMDDAQCRYLASAPSPGDAFPGDPLSLHERRQLTVAYALAAGVREMTEVQRDALCARFAPAPQTDPHGRPVPTPVTTYQRTCQRAVRIAQKPSQVFREPSVATADDVNASDDPRLQLFKSIYGLPGMLTSKSTPIVLANIASTVDEPLLRMEALSVLFRLGAVHAKAWNFRAARRQMTEDLRLIHRERPMGERVESKSASAEHQEERHAWRYLNARDCLNGLYASFRQHDQRKLEFVFQPPARHALAAHREAHLARVTQKQHAIRSTLQFIEEEIAEVDTPVLAEVERKDRRGKLENVRRLVERTAGQEPQAKDALNCLRTEIERLDERQLPALAHEQLRTALEAVRQPLQAALALVQPAAQGDRHAMDD